MGKHDATFENGVALYLPGAGSGSGVSPDAALKPSNFSGAQINRAVHFAGGRVRTDVPLADNYSVELWFWNGLPHEARAVTGYLFSRGPDGDKAARGEHLGIGGTFRGDLVGKLIVFNGNERDEVLIGRTVLAQRAWHHVVLVREGKKVRVHLDGRAEPEIAGDFQHTVPAGKRTVFLGGRNDNLFGLEGRVDEVALYDRALTAPEIAAHYQASALTPPVAAAATPTPQSQPLSPLDSLKKIHVRNGYGVELVAAEPLTMDPVAIDWDTTGRLWVVEMADYPLGLDGKGQPGGRVRVLEDADGDGRYDKSTLFAEGLNFPTGLLTWRGGVIVTAAPDILFLRDSDGDGKADVRDVLVRGLTTGNQQLRANGLRWGLDNWVHCAAGGHHGEYGVGTKLRTRAGEVLVGSRDFRFRPDTGELEPESGPSQFGRNRDDWGHWFGTQNSRPLWHYVLADHYLRRNPHLAAPDPSRQVVVPLNPKVWPVSQQEKRYHSFNEGGHFTSACSGMIYRDELLFSREELHAFTCEPFHNVVQHNVVQEAGVSFTAHRATGEETSEFFASEDRWCRPVMTRTGPDGALWIVDMYRYMIEHPEWLPKEGKAELLPHYRLGDDKGRIYRVFPSGVALRKPANLEALDIAGLVAALDSPNEWQRDKAHLLLVWRADKTAIEPLAKMAGATSDPRARLQALCVLDGLGALSPEMVVQALADAHVGVRENALRLAESRGTPQVIAAAAKLVDDPDAKVRLQLAFTLGEWKDPQAGEALGRLAVAHYAEPFTFTAVMSSAIPHVRALTEASLKAGGQPLAALAEPLAKIARALNEEQTVAALRDVKPAEKPKPPVRPQVPASAANRAKVIEEFQPALKLAGEAARGREIFAQRCVTCHKVGELGQHIGPNLRSVTGHPPEKLLANILDPSADVQPGYYAYLCRLNDGAEIYGLMAVETANSITFKQLDGTTRAVLRKDIASLESTKGSLMPPGLEAGLTPQGLADLIAFLRAREERAETTAAVADLRVGAAAVNLQSDETMPLAGMLEARFTKEQEGELRAVAVVVEKPGAGKVAIVACDVLWVTRAIVDAAAAEIERSTGIPAANVLVNATHTHHAPGTAPAHAFGWSEKFADEVRRGIVQSVQDANARLAEAALHFQLGEERTIGANSRLLLGDNAISWLNPLGEAGVKVQPTGPFDPQLPVLDFRGNDGKTRALIFNHSTHTIGTRSGRDVRSPSFYGLAAQELEAEIGGVVSFVEGASGSTHNIRGVPVPVAIQRMKQAVQATRAQAAPRAVPRVAALKRPFTFRVRTFDEAAEDANVARYTAAYASPSAARIREIFANQRRQLLPRQGEERTTWVQVVLIGDIAIVGVPAEYFTGLGLDIKERSPFKNTYIAELANDWIGYLPDRTGHRLGGYQTWTGLHSYAEPGTGERLADEAVRMLKELAKSK
jgi:putative membrane-bound dehydrogenase-like protein